MVYPHGIETRFRQFHLDRIFFVGLTPEHIIHGLQPHEFATDVHAGLFAGWLHKTVALVAERGIGRGQLLVSTFRLAKNLGRNPVAAAMVNDMVAHLLKA